LLTSYAVGLRHPTSIQPRFQEENMLQIKSAATLACSLALLIGSSPAMAQQTSAPPGARLDAIRKVSTLIGTKVVNQANSTIADIHDLVLAPDGTGTYAILGFGGIAGVDEKYTAIPWQDLNLRQADGKWVANLDMTSDALAKAPTFKTNTYQELTDPQWVSSVQNFFHPGAGAQARPAPRPVESVLLASKVRGAKLRNSQNEDLGKIEDLLLDRAFRVAFAIVGHGASLASARATSRSPGRS
jgi:hypothetical protein